MFQDTHLHIQDIKDPAAIEVFLLESTASGFGRFFNCAITPADWPLIRQMAARDHRIVPFFGFHPWFSDLADKPSLEKLESYLLMPDAFAGEMGLDKARKNIDFELQKDVFAAQLSLAKKYGRPFAVHCVRAWSETIELIKQCAPDIKFLLHSFNGSLEIAREITAMGGYLSIPVRQFLKQEETFDKIFVQLPDDRILIETDFPYQIKWTNAAEYMTAVKCGYERAASLKGREKQSFQTQIFSNGQIFSHRDPGR